MPNKRRNGKWINVSGLLLSAGIAFGGLFLVQSRLSREKADLLQESGKVEVLFPAENGEAAVLGEAEATQPRLTEDQLVQVIQDLENKNEAYPHEPRPTQLTMAQAIEYANNWLKDFLMPHFGLAVSSMGELKADCYLWTPQEDVYGSRDSDPLLSYWTVTLSGKETEAELIIHAVTGQVLDAGIYCSSPVEYQNRDVMSALLCNYSDSFSLGGDYVLVSEKEKSAEGSSMYQSVGTQGLFGVLQTSDTAVSKWNPETEAMEYNELLSIHLYLTYGLPSQPPES